MISHGRSFHECDQFTGHNEARKKVTNREGNIVFGVICAAIEFGLDSEGRCGTDLIRARVVKWRDPADHRNLETWREPS